MRRVPSYHDRLRVTPVPVRRGQLSQGGARFAHAYYLLHLGAQEIAEIKDGLAPGTPAGDLRAWRNLLRRALETCGLSEATRERYSACARFADHVGNPIHYKRWRAHRERFLEELETLAESSGHGWNRVLRQLVAEVLWEHGDRVERAVESGSVLELNGKRWMRTVHKLLNNPLTETILGADWRTLERKSDVQAKAEVSSEVDRQLNEQRAKLRLKLEELGRELEGRPREVLLLRLEGYEYNEIGERLGIAASTARTYLQRATDQIRDRHRELPEFPMAM